jgi:hypothetical protein
MEHHPPYVCWRYLLLVKPIPNAHFEEYAQAEVKKECPATNERSAPLDSRSNRKIRMLRHGDIWKRIENRTSP